MLTENAINYFKCSKEIDPEHLGLSKEMPNNTANVFSVYEQYITFGWTQVSMNLLRKKSFSLKKAK